MKIIPEFTIIEPLGYFDIIEILKHCRIVLTDSGGLQKEAFFFKKPCITLREETEWVELVENGFNRLAATDTKRITDSFRDLLNKEIDFNVQLYGDGKAGEKIIDVLFDDVVLG